jgi:hypothetical protein
MRTLRRYMAFWKSFLSDAKWYSFIPVAIFCSFFIKRRQILSVWPAANAPIQLGPKIVLFMHFDRAGRVRPQLLDYIGQFARSGRSVVFVTNAARLTPDATAALQKRCAAIIIRCNRGYDFGAWCDAVEHLALPRAETQEIIFANDSVFGPLVPMGDMLARLDYAKADIWGLTESWQYRYHLQSFFIAFGPAALRAPAFAKFWRDIKPVPAKAYVIRNYEIGITQKMVKAGLRCAAIWTYQSLLEAVDYQSLEDLIAQSETDTGKIDPILRNRKLQMLRLRDCISRRTALNPTADLWRQLLISGFPFIKRELLRENPAEVEDVSDWLTLVRETLHADPSPILDDLRLMMKDKAP